MQSQPDRMHRSLRSTILLLGTLIMLSGALPLIVKALAASPDSPRVDLAGTHTQPRELEDATQRAIVREYGNAWKNLETALADNRADVLGDSFVGVAQDRFAEQVKEQKASGVVVRYVDNGHHVEATFYSPEGSAIELHDTAQLEMQVLSGGKVIHSETVTKKYLAILTVTDDRWKVRVLQEVQ